MRILKEVQIVGPPTDIQGRYSDKSDFIQSLIEVCRLSAQEVEGEIITLPTIRKYIVENINSGPVKKLATYYERYLGTSKVGKGKTAILTLLRKYRGADKIAKYLADVNIYMKTKVTISTKLTDSIHLFKSKPNKEILEQALGVSIRSEASYVEQSCEYLAQEGRNKWLNVIYIPSLISKGFTKSQADEIITYSINRDGIQRPPRRVFPFIGEIMGYKEYELDISLGLVRTIFNSTNLSRGEYYSELGYRGRDINYYMVDDFQ